MKRSRALLAADAVAATVLLLLAVFTQPPAARCRISVGVGTVRCVKVVRGFLGVDFGRDGQGYVRYVQEFLWERTESFEEFPVPELLGLNGKLFDKRMWPDAREAGWAFTRTSIDASSDQLRIVNRGQVIVLEVPRVNVGEGDLPYDAYHLLKVPRPGSVLFTYAGSESGGWVIIASLPGVDPV